MLNINTKLGAHVASDKRDKFCDLLDAGIACVVSIDRDVVAEVRRRSSGTVIAIRTQRSPMGADNPPNLLANPAIADEWMRSLYPIWARMPGADYYIVNNELDISDLASAEVLNAFYLACMASAETNGYKIGICSFSTGCPSDDGGLSLEDRWAPLLPSVAHAASAGHVVVLHAHALDFGLSQTGRDIAFRHERSLEFFAAHGIYPKALISELSNGVGGIEKNLADYLANIKWWDQSVRQSRWVRQVIGGALYGFNEAEHISAAVPDLVEWIRTVNAQPPVEDGRHYNRIVHLVPPSVSVDPVDLVYRSIVRMAGPGRESITCSADDAFILAPECDSRTIYVYNVDEWGGRVALEAWAERYYAPLPTIVYREI